jgi:threonine/homoserine/homoserine lactone efflux protein
MPEEKNKANPTLVEVFTTFFRAITRPAVTVIFAAVIAQVVVEGIDAPQWFLGLASACILWWFGDRTVQHIKEKKQ